MSTRGLIFVSGLDINRRTETLEMYKGSDAYPRSSLDEICNAIKKAEKQQEEQAAIFKDGRDANPLRASQVAGLLIGEATGPYGMIIHLEKSHEGEFDGMRMTRAGDFWIEWTYHVNLEARTLDVYRTFRKGLVDPCDYAKQLYPEFQERERKTISKCVAAIEALGFRVNVAREQVKASKPRKTNKPKLAVAR